jgi:hypothetical protein
VVKEYAAVIAEHFGVMHARSLQQPRGRPRCQTATRAGWRDRAARADLLKPSPAELLILGAMAIADFASALHPASDVIRRGGRSERAVTPMATHHDP